MRNLIWTTIARLLACPAIVDRLIRRAKRTPFTHLHHRDGSYYMRRFWLFNDWNDVRQRRYKLIPFSIRLHHIVTCDQDRELHDHPWPARTIILRGNYIEIRLEGAHRSVNPETGEVHFLGGTEVEYNRFPGDTATLQFEEFHRIIRVSEGGVWTLFISWPWAGDWGFLVGGVKVWWRKHLGLVKEVRRAH